MGYIRHDAIVVTGFQDKEFKSAHRKAVQLHLEVTEITESKINGYKSFLIIPDGSKEGWANSDNGDVARDAWKKWVRKQKKLYIDFAHVSFGGDEPDNARLVDNNERQ